jgi:multidrug efflux pump subunit AcrA (membrane-fusion protein)
MIALAWYGLPRIGTAQPANSAAASPGRVEGASDVLSLGTSATGTIAELLVAAGEHVHAGQHLVRIECGNIERELQARKADLAAAERRSCDLHGPREEIAVPLLTSICRRAQKRQVYQRTQQLREGARRA